MYTYYEHFKSYLCLSNRFSSTLGLFVTGCIIHLSVEAADFHKLRIRTLHQCLWSYFYQLSCVFPNFWLIIYTQYIVSAFLVFFVTFTMYNCTISLDCFVRKLIQITNYLKIKENIQLTNFLKLFYIDCFHLDYMVLLACYSRSWWTFACRSTWPGETPGRTGTTGPPECIHRTSPSGSRYERHRWASLL